MSQNFDVFLSHNSKDKPAVIELAEALKARKLRPWLDIWDLPPGRPWQEVLEEILESIPAAAVLVGHDGFGPWESVEMRTLLSECVERDLPVIPVLLPGAMAQPELPLFLRPFTWVDLRGGLNTEGLDRLVWGVTGSKVDSGTRNRVPVATSQSNLPATSFSATSLRVRNLPRRNPLFTGRDELLAELKRRLTEETDPIRVQALTGLGGVGKTHLAFEYAYRYDTHYDVVWWVRAEEPTTLASDFADLALAVGLPAHNIADQQIVSSMVRRWLQQNSSWLLILDNAEDPQVVEPYLMSDMRGHVFITSRNPAWGSLASKLEVTEFTPEESRRFLLNPTKQIDEEADATMVAQELGHLPLALEQTRAYIEANNRSLGSYLELLRSHRRELFAKGAAEQNTVATTWEISFQHVEQTSPAAAALLRLCAFLAPEDILCGALARGGEALPQELPDVLANPLRLDEVVGILRRYSLVDFDGDKLSLHRLVHAAIRDRLTPQERLAWAEMAVSLIQTIFPFDHHDVKTWDESVHLLPHVWATTERAIALEVAGETVARLLGHAGQSLGVRADYAGAKAAFEKALAIQESVLHEDHLDTAQTLNDLGWLYDAQGDYEKAHHYHEKALAIRETQLDERSPDLAQSLEQLGGLFESQGEYESARPYYDRALAIYETAFGETHPDTARSLSSLGGLLQAQGDYEGARRYYDRALAIKEVVLGENHPSTAASYYNLGVVLESQGDYEGARPYYDRALAIEEAVLGENHPSTAASLNSLGRFLKSQGDYEGARVYYDRALSIREAVLGENHPDTAGSLNSLGGLLHVQGDYEGARPYYDRALAIEEAVFGENHPSIARSLNNLGMLFRAQGDYEGARPYCEKSLAIQEAVFGENHPNTSLALNNLGLILFDQRKYADARPFLERALKSQEATLGESHPNIVKILLNLGTALASTFHFVAARRHLKRAQFLCKTHHGHQAAMMREIQNHLKRISHGPGKKKKKRKKKRKKGA